jgi:DNA replication protein DnaC
MARFLSSVFVALTISRSGMVRLFAEDERLAGALLDRLTHHVHILEIVGDSYRLKSSLNKGKKKQG